MGLITSVAMVEYLGMGLEDGSIEVIESQTFKHKLKFIIKYCTKKIEIIFESQDLES
jgi:hypothetical protein